MPSVPLSALDRPVAYHRVFRRVSGSTVAAVFLSQLWYWTRTLPPERDGWLYKTQSEMEEETGLSRREQETARKHLKEQGLVEEQRKGNPAKLWYRIDQDTLALAIQRAIKNGGTEQSSMAEPANQECPNPPISHTESTSETTPTPVDDVQRTDSESTDAEQVMAAFASVIGLRTLSRSEKANADELVRQGFGPEDIEPMVKWFRTDPFWSNQSIGLSTLAKHGAKWKATQPIPARWLSQEELRQFQKGDWKYGVYEEGYTGYQAWLADRDNGTLPQLDGRRVPDGAKHHD